MKMLLLCREETVNSTELLRSIKLSKGDSTAFCNGIKYRVTEDSSLIEITQLSGVRARTIKKAISKSGNYPNSGMFSNGVVYNGSAFFYNDGDLWALDLSSLHWRYVSLADGQTNSLWEKSTSDDLLLLPDESKGTLMFSRFRPSLAKCQFVITYKIHILSSEESLNELLRAKETMYKNDGLLMIPSHILDGLREDERNNNEEPRKIPQAIANWVWDIQEGYLPYPRSKAEASEIWKGVTSMKDMEKIKQLRKRNTSSTFSRKCPICFARNPTDRAAFTQCGHLCCLACASQLEIQGGPLMCPICRKRSAFVRIYEDENENSDNMEKKTKKGRTD